MGGLRGPVLERRQRHALVPGAALAASRPSPHVAAPLPSAPVQYLLARMGEITAPAPLPPARETALRGGAFNSAVRELLSYYISLEEYYMEESVAKVGVGAGGGRARGGVGRWRRACPG